MKNKWQKAVLILLIGGTAVGTAAADSVSTPKEKVVVAQKASSHSDKKSKSTGVRGHADENDVDYYNFDHLKKLILKDSA